MQISFVTSAPKNPANVSINSDLLAQARACKINLSATLEQALADKVAQVQRERWLKENQQGSMVTTSGWTSRVYSATA